MQKKKFTVRIYAAHDLDLIYFIRLTGFNLTKAMYSALTAFSNGDSFTINLPENIVLKEINTHKRSFDRVLSLDEIRDKKLIEMIESIKPGYRNCVIKSVLRMYLLYPINEALLTDKSDMSKFIPGISALKENKRITRAGFKDNKNTHIIKTDIETDSEERPLDIFETIL